MRRIVALTLVTMGSMIAGASLWEHRLFFALCAFGVIAFGLCLELSQTKMEG